MFDLVDSLDSWGEIGMFFIRLGLALTVLYAAIVLFFISAWLAKTRLAKHTRNLGISLIVFTVGRVAASVFDTFSGLNFGYFSALVTYTYWIWIDVFLQIRLNKLRSDAVGAEGRQRIADNYNKIWDEMDAEYHKLSNSLGT